MNILSTSAWPYATGTNTVKFKSKTDIEYFVTIYFLISGALPTIINREWKGKVVNFNR